VVFAPIFQKNDHLLVLADLESRSYRHLKLEMEAALSSGTLDTALSPHLVINSSPQHHGTAASFKRKEPPYPWG
jgi:hypothetical protein